LVSHKQTASEIGGFKNLFTHLLVPEENKERGGSKGKGWVKEEQKQKEKLRGRKKKRRWKGRKN
jgi:hypothetical protein